MQARDFLQPVKVLHRRATLEDALDSISQRIPVFVDGIDGWAFMRPEAVVGYPSTRQMIDLPLYHIEPVAADTDVEDVIHDGNDIPVAVEEFGRIIGCVDPMKLSPYRPGHPHGLGADALLLRVVEPVTHDLANALFALQAALHEEADSESRASQAALRHTTSVLSRLRSLCSGGMEDAPKCIDVRDVLSGMLELLQLVCGGGVRIHLETQDPLPPVRAYEQALERTLLNLVLNACEATRQKGEIVIQARLERQQRSPCVVISVEDDGPGIDREIADQVFLPGVSSKTGVARGLGLDSIVQAMSRMGGSVRCRQSILGGAAFELRFDAAE